MVLTDVSIQLATFGGWRAIVLWKQFVRVRCNRIVRKTDYGVVGLI